MNQVRSGTFWCWLFGHKFLSEDSDDYIRESDGAWMRKSSVRSAPFCVRCGYPNPWGALRQGKSRMNPVVARLLAFCH
jgi:hypothetical protein